MASTKGAHKDSTSASPDSPAKSHHILPLETRKELAIQYINDMQACGRNVALTATARKFGLAPSSLHDCLRGRKMRQEARVPQQLLSPATEQVLVEWIQFWGARGIPMTTHNIQAKALVLAGTYVGECWIYQFKKRHPELKSVLASTIDAARAKQVNITVVQEFYDLLLEEVVGHHIPPKNIFNMDKKGIVCGQDEYVKVWVDRKQKNSVTIAEKERKLTTVIECVCADGQSIQPMIIFKGVRQSKQWCVQNDNGMDAV